MKYIPNLLLPILLLAFACNNNTGEKSDNDVTEDPLELVVSAEKIFHLNDSTAPTSTCFQFVPELNNYLMLNEFTNEIIFYDYDNGSIVNKIHFPAQGPNGIGKKGLSFLYANKDSIFISNSWQNKIFLFDEKGTYKNSYLLEREGIEEGFMTGKDNLIFLMNGTLYIPAGITGALLDDNTALKNFYKLDLTTGVFSKDYNRPDTYNKGNWGANCMMELSYSTINRKDNFIIRSIPVDADIYVYQNDQLVEKHQVKSKYFDEVPPMSLNRDKEMDWKKSVVYDYSTSHYYNIIYDEYRDVYYRLTLLGNTIDEISNPEIQYDQEFTIMVLDNKFKVLGETKFQRNKYLVYNTFVNENGLHIQLNPKNYTNENQMEFKVLSFNRNLL